jgi:hypothetical protein
MHFEMFRYHFPRNKCNIIITEDIAEPVLKAKDISLFTTRRSLGCFSMEENYGAGIGCQNNFSAFSV